MNGDREHLTILRGKGLAFILKKNIQTIIELPTSRYSILVEIRLETVDSANLTKSIGVNYYSRM